MKLKLTVILIALISNVSFAQQVKDFFYVEPEAKNLPVFVRGNLNNNTIF